MKRICITLALMSVFVMTSCITPPPPKKPVVLVVPSRYTIVQISFDIMRLRPVTLVAYDSDSDPESPIMHVWHRQSRQWLRTTKAEYETGSGISASPNEVIVVGSELDLPAGLSKAPPWCENVRVIPTLRVADLINDLDKSMSFTAGEWRWLASRHRLKIKDFNAERRRYGRYGKPGSKPKVPMPQDSEEVILPAPAAKAAPIEPVSPIDDPAAPAIIDAVEEKGVSTEPDMAPEDK